MSRKVKKQIPEQDNLTFFDYLTFFDCVVLVFFIAGCVIFGVIFGYLGLQRPAQYHLTKDIYFESGSCKDSYDSNTGEIIGWRAIDSTENIYITNFRDYKFKSCADFYSQFEMKIEGARFESNDLSGNPYVGFVGMVQGHSYCSKNRIVENTYYSWGLVNYEYVCHKDYYGDWVFDNEVKKIDIDKVLQYVVVLSDSSKWYCDHYSKNLFQCVNFDGRQQYIASQPLTDETYKESKNHEVINP